MAVSVPDQDLAKKNETMEAQVADGIERNIPQGTSCLVFKHLKTPDPKLLFGKRLNSHGHMTWGLPGGGLDKGDKGDLVACALREVQEETGLKIENIEFVSRTYDPFFKGDKQYDEFKKQNKEYITNFMVCTLVDENAEAKIMEPNRCGEWRWFLLHEVTKMISEKPDEMFSPLPNQVSVSPDFLRQTLQDLRARLRAKVI
jgi:8-oxo-dGTP diphosphatase